jgi:hypothetical protein
MSSPPHRLIVLFLCVFAALRVGIYSAGFPVFNNVDELMHFDLVIKYSEGKFPHRIENISATSARYITGCGSAEYGHWDPETAWKNKPLFMVKPAPDDIIQGLTDYWVTRPNYESGQGPVYYALAALWKHLGDFLIPAESCLLPYWIRFLNLLLIALLVWISYKTALLTFPGNNVMIIGVPLFTAILPQDTFYSIQNDVLSPVFFGFTFIAVIHLIRSHVPSIRWSLIAGASVSLAVLTKTNNLPLILLVVAYVTVRFFKLLRTEKFADIRKPFIYFYISALVPVGIWFIANSIFFGDILASAGKIEFLQWKYKSLSEWLNTSFLTGHGVLAFWTELMATFWRGEIVWSSAKIAMPGADNYYWLSTSILMVFAAFSLFKKQNEFQKRIIQFCFASFLAVLFFMIFLSLCFDFPHNAYPSFEKPFFTSGRLMSGCLIPFLFLYLLGFQHFFSWIKNEKIKISLLFLIALLITLSEISISQAPFTSNYNFFSVSS